MALSARQLAAGTDKARRDLEEQINALKIRGSGYVTTTALAGGATGEVLTKDSSASGDYSWQAPTGGGATGNLDGGNATSTYGGTTPINGGGA